MGQGEAIEGIGGVGIGRFVGMDEERLFTVGLFDVFVWDTRLEIQDVVGVGAEGASNSLDF